MSQQGIDASKVNTPIQLLAAWFVGLILVNGSFLAAASQIREPDWAAGWLVIAAVFNVPLFLGCLFLLQTRFRAEMQEDSYYSKHLERRSSQTQKLEYVEVSAAAPPTQKSRSIRVHQETRHVSDGLLNFQSVTAIEFNNLLPFASALKRRLKDRGLGIASEFGSRSVTPVEPNPFIITFGPSIDPEVLKIVIAESIPFGLKGVRRTDGFLHVGRIYVGSYSYMEQPLDQSQSQQDLEALTRPDMSLSEIEEATVLEISEN